MFFGRWGYKLTINVQTRDIGRQGGGLLSNGREEGKGQSVSKTSPKRPDQRRMTLHMS